MTLEQFTDAFILEYSGKTLGFPYGQYVGECLSLAKVFIQEYYGIYPPASGCNGARCYWSIFPNPLGTVLKKVANTPDLIPQKGWICVWDGDTGGGYGHIGIVVSANINTFTSFDQNWGGRQAHLVEHNYNNVYGFLVPLNEEAEGGNMANYYKGYDLENPESMKVAVDVLVRLQNGELVEKQKLDDLKVTMQKQIDIKDAKVQELQKKIDEHVCPVTEQEQPTLNGTMNGYQRQYEKDGVLITENYTV